MAHAAAVRTLTVALAAVLVASLAAAGTIVATPVADGGQAAVQDEESAFLRAVHAAPGAPNVDVYLDGELAVSNVSFGTITDYLEVGPGVHEVRLTAAGEPNATVFEDEVTLDPGLGYTTIAVGEMGEDSVVPFQVGFLVDNAPTPPADTSLVRIVHAAPRAPAVDVTVAGSDVVLADNVTFGTATPYVAVPAGDYTVEVRAATPNETGQVVGTFDASVEGGTAYSAFAVGYLDPATAPADVPFDVLLATDRTLPAENVTAPTVNETVTPAVNVTANETTATAADTTTTEAGTAVENETVANETTGDDGGDGGVDY